MKEMKAARDPWLDNIKGILVILVVIGHMTAALVGTSEGIDILYKMINSFHMPCFFLITGYTSRRRIQEHDHFNTLTRLFIPYLVAQFMLWCFAGLLPYGMEQVVGQSPSKLTWLFPGYHLWYLLAIALFCFVMPWLTCLFRKVPWLFLILAFICSVLVGMGSEVSYMRISKSIAYFPFFLIGYYLSKEKLNAIRDKVQLKAAAIIIIACWAYFIIQYNEWIYVKVLTMASCYAKYRKAFLGIYGPAARTIYLLCAVPVSIAFMSLVTKRKTIFTYVGKNSLYVYILHGFFVVALRTIDAHYFSVYPHINTTAERVVFVLSGVVLGFILASPPVVKIFKPFFEPKISIEKIKTALKL